MKLFESFIFYFFRLSFLCVVNSQLLLGTENGTESSSTTWSGTSVTSDISTSSSTTFQQTSFFSNSTTLVRTTSKTVSETKPENLDASTITVIVVGSLVGTFLLVCGVGYYVWKCVIAKRKYCYTKVLPVNMPA